MIATSNQPGETTRRAPGILAVRLLLKLVWLIYLSAIISYGLLFVRLWWTDDLWRADFIPLYSAGAMVLAGDGASLYDASVAIRYQQAMVGERMVVERAMLYGNPPFAALLLAPLALLPPAAAYLAWCALQLGLVAWVLWLVRPTALAWSADERRLLWAATLAYLPLFTTILVGNFPLALLVCLWQLARALWRGREGAAGAWLVLGLIKPQVWVLVVVMLLAARRWRVLASATLVGGGLVLLSSLVLGWTIWPAWLARLAQSQDLFVAGMWNARAGLARWFGPSHTELVGLLGMVLLASAAGVTVWLWRGPWRPAAPATAARLALTVALGLLTTPYLYSHDTVMLTMAATVGYDVLRGSGQWRRPYAAFVLGAPLALLAANAVVGSWLGGYLPILLMAGLVGWLVVAVRHADRAGAA